GDREFLGYYKLQRTHKMIIVIGFNGVVTFKEIGENDSLFYEKVPIEILDYQ
ncbi:hypothetical protein HAX54_035718, partial [Datura stramonium]|nr:hypothetical protein [Datura stramonium]